MQLNIFAGIVMFMASGVLAYNVLLYKQDGNALRVVFVVLWLLGPAVLTFPPETLEFIGLKIFTSIMLISLISLIVLILSYNLKAYTPEGEPENDLKKGKERIIRSTRETNGAFSREGGESFSGENEKSRRKWGSYGFDATGRELNGELLLADEFEVLEPGAGWQG